MKKTFLGPHDRNHKDHDIHNPYHNGVKQWDEHLGSKNIQLRNWQRIAFLMGWIAVIAVMGCVYMSNKASVIPYIIEVEAKGNVRLVGKVTEQDWSIDQSKEVYILHGWIERLRKIYKSPEPMVDNFTNVRLHATDEGNMLLDQYMKTHKPLVNLGKQIRTVHIIATTAIQGKPHAYRVEWQEKYYSATLKRTQTMVGEFHLSIDPPRTEQQMFDNAMGVYISFFDISKKRQETQQ